MPKDRSITFAKCYLLSVIIYIIHRIVCITSEGLKWQNEDSASELSAAE